MFIKTIITNFKIEFKKNFEVDKLRKIVYFS